MMISNIVLAGNVVTPRFQIVVEGHQLISDDDISSFDWDSQTIYLTAKAQDRIAALPWEWVPLQHSSFVVLIDGDQAYSGHVCSLLSSLSPPAGPVISWPIGRLRNYFQIHPDCTGSNLDIRFDESVRRTLIELGKIEV